MILNVVTWVYNISKDENLEQLKKLVTGWIYILA